MRQLCYINAYSKNNKEMVRLKKFNKKDGSGEFHSLSIIAKYALPQTNNNGDKRSYASVMLDYKEENAEEIYNRIMTEQNVSAYIYFSGLSGYTDRDQNPVMKLVANEIRIRSTPTQSQNNSNNQNNAMSYNHQTSQGNNQQNQNFNNNNQGQRSQPMHNDFDDDIPF